MNRRLRVAAVATLAAFVALDVAVHLFVVRGHWRPVPPFGALTNEAQLDWLSAKLEPDAGERGIGRFDPVLGWSLRPNASTPDGRTTTNSRGWRGSREYADEAPAGTLRIVCIGDSFTFCEEVADDGAWPALLERRLEGKAEVVNLGVGGYGTDQAFMRLGREYPRTAVDVVFIGLLLENIGRNVNRYRPRWYPRAESAVAKPRFIEGPETLETVFLPYERELDLLRAIHDESVLDDLAEHEYWLDDHVPGPLALSGLWRMVAGQAFYRDRELPRLWAATDDEPFRVTTRILAAAHSFARAPEGNAAKLATVVVFPTKDDLAQFRATGERYWQPLLDWLAARAIPFVDLSDALARAEEERSPDAPPLWAFSHLSSTGNAVVARALHEFLDREL